VAGGLAKYFAIDPAIVRIVFIALSFVSGLGIVSYLIFAVAVKEDATEVAGNRKENAKEFAAETGEKAKELVKEAKRLKRDERMNVLGIVLIFVGVLLLLDKLFPWGFFREKFLLPALLVLLGLILVWKSR
jgi:phage shock protein C